MPDDYDDRDKAADVHSSAGHVRRIARTIKPLNADSFYALEEAANYLDNYARSFFVEPRGPNQWVVIVFFNADRTDYVTRGPFSSQDAAMRDADAVWDNYQPGGIAAIGVKMLEEIE